MAVFLPSGHYTFMKIALQTTGNMLINVHISVIIHSDFEPPQLEIIIKGHIKSFFLCKKCNILICFFYFLTHNAVTFIYQKTFWVRRVFCAVSYSDGIHCKNFAFRKFLIHCSFIISLLKLNSNFMANKMNLKSRRNFCYYFIAINSKCP